MTKYINHKRYYMNTTTRVIFYEKRKNGIEVTGDSYGKLKGEYFKSASELEKIINKKENAR